MTKEKTELMKVYYEGHENGCRVYTFNKIDDKDFMDFINGDSDKALEAIFKTSDEEFECKNVKWGLNSKSILYVDRIVINVAADNQIIYDAVSDMIVEDAVAKHMNVVRVKVDRESIIGYVLQKNGYNVVGFDDNYKYLEIDVQYFKN